MRSEAPASNGENEHPIVRFQPAALKPCREHSVSQPSSFVRAVSSENVIGGRIGLKSAELSEIVDRVPGVASAPTHSQYEKPSTPITNTSQPISGLLNHMGLNLVDHIHDFIEELFAERFHGYRLSGLRLAWRRCGRLSRRLLPPFGKIALKKILDQRYIRTKLVDQFAAKSARQGGSGRRNQIIPEKTLNRIDSVFVQERLEPEP